MAEEKIMTERLQSLDALRGFDMFWIMGGGLFIAGLAQLTGWAPLEWFAAQQEHAEWHGFHFEDLIFPLFLFMAGVSMPFSILKRQARGDSMKDIYYHLVRRTVVLILLGMLYNRVQIFEPGHYRLSSVLSRIALGSFFAALIVLNSKKVWHYVWFAGILLGYWAVSALIPAPGHAAGDFSREGCLAGYIDRLLIPWSMPLENGLIEPEGILSTIPSVATALLGVLTGHFLKTDFQQWSKLKKGIVMTMAGVVFLLLGILWNEVFPINKKLWTSSFVLFAGGWSLILFSVFYLVIDVWEYRSWAFFFVVIGMNSILSYLMQPALCMWCVRDFFFRGIINHTPENLKTLVDAITYIATCWSFLYFCYRKKIFLKV